MRHLGFLHHIGEILEADEGEEGEQAGIGDAGQRAGIERRRLTSADAIGTPA